MSSNRSLIQERMNGSFPLSPDISIDFDRCMIYVGNHTQYPLTAREIALLTFLVEAPARYHSSSLLATKISTPGSLYPVSEHSVEQTISSLRRKLGEDGKCPRLLLSRRGIGYGLFSQGNQRRLLAEFSSEET